MAITVAIVDDHPAILAGITAWLAASDPPIRVVATGSSVDAALTPPGREADVVILDLVLGDGQPCFRTTLGTLADRGRAVLVYTMCEDEDVALTCLDLGAAAVLAKAEGPDHLVAAVRAAAENRPYLPPALAGAIAANSDPCQPKLSEREREVLTQWFQCESKKEVANRTGVSVRTVGTFLDRARLKYAKAGRPAHTKAALLARAVQDGLIDINDL